MVAQPSSSKRSTRNGGQTSKSAKENDHYSLLEEAEILTQALRRYQAAGGTVTVIPDFSVDSRQLVALIFDNAEFRDGAIVPLVARDGGTHE